MIDEHHLMTWSLHLPCYLSKDVCYSLSCPFNTKIVFVFSCLEFGLYDAMCYFCEFYVFLYFSLFIWCIFVYICVFSVYFRQYNRPSGPSVVDFK